MALVICTWLWGDKYGPLYVDRLHAGLRKHVKQPFRFMVVTEIEKIDSLPHGIERRIIEDTNLLRIPGCFARLRMFDPKWQRACDITERLVCLDLDTIVTGPLDPLFDRPEPLMVLQGANASNPCPFNCSVMMLRPGYREDLFSEFSLEAADKIPRHDFPDDQGWLWHRVPDAAGWQVGSASGIYAFQKPGWPKGDPRNLPPDARLVCFPGWRDPQVFNTLPWVREHWMGLHADPV